MNIKILLTFIASLYLLTGCGGYKTGVVLEAQKSYLFFNAAAQGAEYSVDGSSWYKIQKTGENELYPTLPGKHRIKVRKGESVIVDKMVLLGDSMSKEIKVY
jgi:hypothetical protein